MAVEHTVLLSKEGSKYQGRLFASFIGRSHLKVESVSVPILCSDAERRALLSGEVMKIGKYELSMVHTVRVSKEAFDYFLKQSGEEWSRKLGMDPTAEVFWVMRKFYTPEIPVEWTNYRIRRRPDG